MKFDLWTFVFQIVNFAILALVLKRLLFNPVRRIMQERKGMVERYIKEAEHAKEEGAKIKADYEKELTGLKESKGRMMEEMQEEVATQRKRLMGEAEEKASGVIEKRQAVLELERAKMHSEVTSMASEAVSRFAMRLMKDLSTEQLHAELCGRLKSAMDDIARDIIKTAPAHAGDAEVEIEIISARALPEGFINTIREKLESALGSPVKASETGDDSLIAGVRMRAMDTVYDFSIEGQIADFKRRVAREEPGAPQGTEA